MKSQFAHAERAEECAFPNGACGLWFILFTVFSVFGTIRATPGDYVVLVHGLSRSAKCFCKMERCLRDSGYAVFTIDYPSTQGDIQTLTAKYIEPVIRDSCQDKAKQVHFVTHSMGGILVRYYLASRNPQRIGRVVMLSPPNRGSEMVDFLRKTYIVPKLLGPAYLQLATDGFVRKIEETNHEIGVITGTRSINWLNSIIIDGDDDGKVSVERAKLPRMKDFLVVKRTHPMIMDADEVISASVRFIETGRFPRN